MIFITSFYNRKTKSAETVITPLGEGDNVDSMHKSITEYINGYCPVEYRMVDDKDSLYIYHMYAKIDIYDHKNIARVQRNPAQ